MGSKVNSPIKMLLVADTKTHEALGSKFMRGAVDAGIDPTKEIITAYNSPNVIYSPSMRRKIGKLFYRLADRRSIEWWEFQREVKGLILRHEPRLVLVTGTTALAPEIFREVQRYGGRIVNYLTDDPWNSIHRRRSFLRTLDQYDHVFSTKKALMKRLERHGVKSTSWLPFAYDPSIHHPAVKDKEHEVDVVFVGTGARERLKWLDAIATIPGLTCRIHGNSWERYSTPGWEQCGEVVGEMYCKALGSARIALGLLREANGDLSTDRSYEIGAIHACGIYQDTPEHRKLLAGYPEEGFFKTPEELKERVEKILRDQELQERMRSIGAARLSSDKDTYGARLRHILEWNEAVL